MLALPAIQETSKLLRFIDSERPVIVLPMLRYPAIVCRCCCVLRLCGWGCSELHVLGGTLAQKDKEVEKATLHPQTTTQGIETAAIATKGHQLAMRAASLPTPAASAATTGSNTVRSQQLK